MNKLRLSLMIFCWLFSIHFLCYGQSKVNIEGFFNKNDTSKTAKKTASIYVLIKMVIADTVFQSTFINDNGFFKFYKPSPTKDYKLEFTCLGNSFKPTIKIQEKRPDKIVFNCHFDISHFLYSLCKGQNFKFPNCITYEYCGLPAYSDYKLKFYSQKYGLRYENMGCYGFDEKAVNKEAIKKLNRSLGDNWEEVFWTEIELKIK